jgi:hypothetical protein
MALYEMRTYTLHDGDRRAQLGGRVREQGFRRVVSLRSSDRW